MNTSFSFEVGAATEIGARHKANQDAFKLDPTNALFLIADGVGGSPAGDVASRVAVNAAYGAFLREPQTEMGAHQPGKYLKAAIREAHAALLSVTDEASIYQGMATTLLITWLPGGHNRIYIAHIGDCRCYLVRQNRVAQLTRDHTVFNALCDAGQLPEDPARWPSPSLLSQALGESEVIEPESLNRSVWPDDFYFLCTDGVHVPLSPAALAEIITQSLHPQLICEAVIQAALNAGGEDNLTAIGIRISPYEIAQDVISASVAMSQGG